MAPAKTRSPKAAAHEAFIRINAITPLFTAFPILGPSGFRIADCKGGKMSRQKNSTNGKDFVKVLLDKETRRMATATTIYKAAAKYKVFLLPP